MKNILLVMMMAVGPLAFAQSPDKAHADKNAGHGVTIGEIQNELNLSSEQILALKKIHEEFKGKFNALLARELSEKEFAEQEFILNREKMLKVNHILTPVQQAKVKEYIKPGKKGKLAKGNFA